MTKAEIDGVINALPTTHHVYAFRRINGRMEVIGNGLSADTNTNPLTYSITSTHLVIESVVQHQMGPQIPVKQYISLADISEIIAYA